MTTLTFQKIPMQAADLGPRNCLPDIKNDPYIHTEIIVADQVSQEDRKHINQGMIDTLLPYQIQDQYDRNITTREMDGAILENEYLRALFLPQLGGRLWSLYDKKEGRELLYRNPVFQPANLALLNAWFSGGVEWNLGIKGHTPLTCSTLFTKEGKNENGDPILKMYEYERIRGVAYSINATLQEDVLLVHMTIENTKDEETFMYWWSNMAVEETPKTRVLVPAPETFTNIYLDGANRLGLTPIPYNEKGVDLSYPVNYYNSQDMFFKIPEENKKWIAAVDEHGKGLVQFSDQTLIGRKLFVWGQQPGGRHWNEWLSHGGAPYIEIQAGLLHTQLEHFPMAPNSSISWTEGYKALSADPAVLHGADYNAATAAVEAQVGEKFNVPGDDFFRLVTEEPLTHLGSGWGALENIVRAKPISAHCDFTHDSLNEEQGDWLALLNSGALPQHDIQDTIPSYVHGQFWIDLLEKNLKGTWYEYNHLGVMYYEKHDLPKAEENFRKSIEAEANPWALRNLAQLEKNEYGNPAAAAELMLQAVAIKADYQPLLVNCADALIASGQYSKWLEIYATLSDELKANGRLRFHTALCHVRCRNVEEALEFVNADLVVDDIKECELALSEIWFELYRIILARETGKDESDLTNEMVQERYPIPWELDFRMM